MRGSGDAVAGPAASASASCVGSGARSRAWLRLLGDDRRRGRLRRLRRHLAALDRSARRADHRRRVGAWLLRAAPPADPRSQRGASRPHRPAHADRRRAVADRSRDDHRRVRHPLDHAGADGHRQRHRGDRLSPHPGTPGRACRRAAGARLHPRLQRRSRHRLRHRAAHLGGADRPVRHARRLHLCRGLHRVLALLLQPLRAAAQGGEGGSSRPAPPTARRWPSQG